MRPLEINLARRPYRNDLPLGVFVSLLLIGALLFTGSNLYTWFTADAQLAKLKQEMVDHESRMRAMEQEASKLQAELADIDLELLVPQAEFVDSVLQQRNFSWTLLFNAMEEVLPWSVRLSVIRPRFQLGSVLINISGMARDFDGYLAFQEALLASPYFSDVVPAGYEVGSSDSRLVFALDVQYLAAVHRADQFGKTPEVLEAGNEIIVVEGEDPEDPPVTATKAAPSPRRKALDGPEAGATEDVELASGDAQTSQPASKRATGSGGRPASGARSARSGKDRPGRRGSSAAGSGSAGSPATRGDHAGTAMGAPAMPRGARGVRGGSAEGLLPRPAARPGAKDAGPAGAGPGPAASGTGGAEGRARPEGKRPTGSDVPPPEVIEGRDGPMLGSPLNPDKPLPWDPTKGGPPEQGDGNGGAEEGGSEGDGGESGSSSGGGTAS